MPRKRSNRNEQQDHFDRRTPVPGEEAGETESELTMLLDQTIAELTEGMSEEEAAAYVAGLFEGGEAGNEQMLFAHVVPEVTESMAVTNYRPDQAMREASLAQKDQWKPTDSGEIA